MHKAKKKKKDHIKHTGFGISILKNIYMIIKRSILYFDLEFCDLPKITYYLVVLSTFLENFFM